MTEPQRFLLEPHDLTFVEDVPYIYHCSHYNLFHDQTVDDVLGDAPGHEVRVRAAHAAFRQLLQAITQGASTPMERLSITMGAFAAMGHGRLALDVTAEGGSARTGHAHYGFCWSEKYGSRVSRTLPADAVAAGFVAAATEVAYDLPAGTMQAVEETCVARREPECTFRVTRAAAPVPLPPTVDRQAMEAFLGPSEGGMDEAWIGATADTLQQFVAGMEGDERGLMESFGVFITRHLTNYYLETAYAAARQAPESALPIVESLLREAAHVCVFHTFGGILLSPEWESVAGRLSGEPEDIVRGCVAIARGLGFGRWAIQELGPDRLVLSTTSNYEAPYYSARFGKSDRPRCYFFQGAALAMMVLAHRVRWDGSAELTQSFYDDLFRGPGLGFRCEPTTCQTMGHERTEVVVQRT